MTKLLIWLLCKLLYYRAKYYQNYIHNEKGRFMLTFTPRYNLTLTAQSRKALLDGNMESYYEKVGELYDLEGHSVDYQELSMLRVIKENTQ